MHLAPTLRVLLAGVGVVALLTGCASDAPTTASTSTPTPTPTPFSKTNPLRLAVIGDSNTNGFSGTWDTGVERANAYICYITDAAIESVGGWANNGASSTYMAQMVTPIEDVDVLAVMIGTNNKQEGVTPEALVGDIDRAVATIAPRNVVILAIPPMDAAPEIPVSINAQLAGLADKRDWDYFDPWLGLRGSDDKWEPEFLRDGLHTTRAGYEKMGINLQEHLKDTF